MKKIKQFRYYSDTSKNNYPKQIMTYGNLHSRNIFEDLGAVTHIGIQAPSGTEFYLNNSSSSIKVGSTGIYELDLQGMGSITAIRFSKTSLEAIENWTDGLIIDVLYEEVGL